MEVKSVVAYQGPNIHAHFPVIRYTIDLGILEEWPTARLGQGFIDRLFLAIYPTSSNTAAPIQPPAGLCDACTKAKEPDWAMSWSDVTDSVHPSPACGWREIE